MNESINRHDIGALWQRVRALARNKSDTGHGHDELGKIESGSYTGDGASPRTIDVSFAPSAVIVQMRDAPSDASFMTVGWTLNQSRGIVAASEVGQGNEMALTEFFHCTTEGFEISGGTYFNDSGQVYDYIAFL